MEYFENISIFKYAEELGCSKCLTFLDVFSFLLNGIDCIVCCESAVDLLGYSNGGFRNKIFVYSTKKIDLPYIECIEVSSLSNIPYETIGRLKVSPINNALIDMLSKKECDNQILFEAFANYYCKNNNTYEGLEFPKKLSKKAELFLKEGKIYYET